jgi:hypothetical protein
LLKNAANESQKIFLPALKSMDWMLLLGYIAIILIAAFDLQRISINHDVAGFVLEVKGLREGKGISDMNMPSNLWLAYVSVFISEYVSYYLADIHLTLLFIFALICTTLVFCLMQESHSTGYLLRFAVVLGSTSVLLITPGYVFGQREHLFALSCAPLLTLQYQRYASEPIPRILSILVVLAAAFGASLKPFFMVFLLGLGAMDLALKDFKKIAWELILLYFLIAVYLLWITLAHPTYFPQILPGALATYGSMRLPLDLTLLMGLVVPFASIELFFINIAMYGFGLFLSRQIIWDRLFLAFIFLGISAWLLGLMQRFGLDYHFLPFKLLVGCASVIIFAWLLDKVVYRLGFLRAVRNSQGILPYALVLGYLLILPSQLDPDANIHLTRQSVLADEFTRTLQALPPRSPILMLSTRPAIINPVQAYSDIRWTGSFINLLGLLPAANAHAQPSEKDKALFDGPFHGIKDSFLNPAPEFVFVDVSKVMMQFLGFHHPDIINFLSRDPEFQKIWSEYRKIGHVNTIFGQEVDIYQKNSKT